MKLRRVEIKGFRGIHQLVLDIDPKQMVLIGENTWGKSSLLSALTLLSPSQLLYQFTESDFYSEHVTGNITEAQAEVIFIFNQNKADQLNNDVFYPLQGVMTTDESGNKQIIYQIRGYANRSGTIISEHYFLNNQRKPYSNIANVQTLITHLITLRPILRLKNPLIDASHLQVTPATNEPSIKAILAQFIQDDMISNKQQLEQGLHAAYLLLDYYLIDKQRRNRQDCGIMSSMVFTSSDWAILNRFNHFLDSHQEIRLIVLRILIESFNAAGNDYLSPDAKPILLLEEPESQLHPILFSIAIHLLNNIPIQQIITTNSSDMLSLCELETIYRLIRYPHYIAAYHLSDHALNSSDSRRIKFHLLHRYPSALFARTWLCVEGETEVWLLSELAKQVGYDFNSEGIKIIEFVQCGLKPLIKFADLMGIQWHVLTDGDNAGKNYVETVKLLLPASVSTTEHLTILPAKDIENFLFHHGFSHIYKMAAFGSTEYVELSISQIIQKAIHKTSKPDLAVAVCEDAEQRGNQTIPTLFKQLFAKVLKLSRSASNIVMD
jgi:putative ATP-dependent endonuclease of the OLD family